MTATVLASGLVTETPFAPEPLWVAFFFGGALLCLPAFLNAPATGAVKAIVSVGAIVGLFGGIALAIEYAQAGDSVDETEVARSVSAAYRIDSPTPKEGGLLGLDVPDPEELCAPVSPESPEYSGVVNGSEIEFRVGFPDCDASDPHIIITNPAGSAIDVNDLRRKQ